MSAVDLERRHCPEHAGLAAAHATLTASLDAIKRDTALIIQTLHGRLGDSQPGLVAVIRELETRVTRLEATQTLVRNKALDLFVRLAPWLITGALFAFQVAKTGAPQ